MSTETKTEPVTVTNPWHRSTYESSKPTLTYTGKCLLNYRGVEVYKNPAGSWDYTFAGMAITQRAGFNLERAMRLIDQMLAGECLLVCDTVREHIAKNHIAVA
jgi:hypothetical protein